MRVVIAGSSGLIGTALRRAYERAGDDVTRLVRRRARAAGEVGWDPDAPDPRLLDGTDIVVNLAGAPIGGRRWTRRYRETILTSRTGPARALAEMVARSTDPPGMLLSASGIRYYGIDRGDEVLTEQSAGDPTGLLPSVAHAWEEATGPASRAGIAVCHLRLGLVLSRQGGLLPPLLRMARLGVGTYFGSGREYWSFVSLADTVRAIRFLAAPGAPPRVSGEPRTSGAVAVNVTAPNPVPHKDVMRTLGSLTGARGPVGVPLPALRLVLGPIADEVFGGLRVQPARLSAAGFTFDHPDVGSALRAALGD